MKNEYEPGDLVRWIWDSPETSSPGVLLKLVTKKGYPMAEVRWTDNNITSVISLEDIVLISSVRST